MQRREALLQLPADEVCLLVASCPLGGFKPGSAALFSPAPHEKKQKKNMHTHPMTFPPPRLASDSDWPQIGRRTGMNPSPACST